MIEHCTFIKPDFPFDPADKTHNYAPVYRRSFTLTKLPEKALLEYVALGMGHVYINGRRINADVFGTDEAAWHKTVWYNTADVASFLQPGKNTIAVLCGNGFFNEPYHTSWDYDQARWRDHPKFIASLSADGKEILTTDASWKYFVGGPIVSNMIRGGERYDARLEEDFFSNDFDDSAWPNARVDNTPPTGVFRTSFIPPVIEAEVIKAEKIVSLSGGRILYDFGKNMAGYARLSVTQKAGDEIIIRYGEDFDGEHIHSPIATNHYPENEYQTDHVICSGKPIVWSPTFSYHGFRYIELTGLSEVTDETVKAVFIHQDIAHTASFSCSNEKLNKLYEIGVQACYSNFVSKVTDCPTREKLGWANDLQASTEQMLTNFDIADYFRKHIMDTCDSMLDDGMMPGIIPTDVWGYGWGNGPVSEGLLFEQCYQLYVYTGDKKPLIDCIPFFLRSIQNFRDKADETGFAAYGLTDWAPPTPTTVPVQFINGALLIHFLRITRLAASFAGDSALAARMDSEIAEDIARFRRLYIKEDGSCVYPAMTAAAMIIYFDLTDKSLEPLKAQLIADIEAHNFHHDCGMVGLRRLYYALDKCGLSDYAYKIITAEGFPGYMEWLNRGATTLWEMWDCGSSHNHHMYSDFMQWLIKTLCGIKVDPAHPAFERVIIAPFFESSLDWAKAEMNTLRGKISSAWERTPQGIKLTFTVPANVTALYNGSFYSEGEWHFTL